LGIARASFYRHLTADNDHEPVKPRPSPPLALTREEEHLVLDTLHSERFVDSAPHQVYATLLDEGKYYCSIRTMYRILDKHQEVKERRRQVSRPHYVKPELLATGPNQVWSWDITKLKGPEKWTYFYLYVIIDIFSRYVVGWMIAPREQSSLAARLIEQSCEKHHIPQDQLVIHADRGSSMTSKLVAHLLADLGVVKTHSRPYVSNDNPYSESQFKTMKYCPQFPERFGSIQDGRSFCCSFFPWYNTVHRHSGIGLMTPEQVHYGMAKDIYSQRAKVLEAAAQKSSARFKGKTPKPPSLPEAAWINPPKDVRNS
jgi:putative transposase